MKNARARAASALAAVLGRGLTLDEALAQAIGPLAGRERALCREIAFGACRRFFELDAVLAQLLERPLKDKDVDVRALLLCGLYQIRWMRVPAHAAVAESVNACRALGKPWAAGLVNAVLRSFLKRADALLAALDRAASLAHPTWLLEALERAWPTGAAALLAANNTPAPLTVRVNTARTTRALWLARAASAGLDPVAGTLSDTAVVLGRAVEVSALPGFAEGEVSVQDEAAQLAAPLLDAQPGERVLDACAAPGGKASQLLERVPGLALTALDVSSARLERIHENLRRLGLQAEVVAGDAANPRAWWDGRSYDRILVDAPCSGTGVIRRHPDIRLLRTPAQVREAVALQARILAGLWPLLRPGGVLLYCTCSVLPEENEGSVDAFLATTADARCEPIDAGWGIATAHGRQLLPQADGHDGFYYARLRRSLGL